MIHLNRLVLWLLFCFQSSLLAALSDEYYIIMLLNTCQLLLYIFLFFCYPLCSLLSCFYTTYYKSMKNAHNYLSIMRAYLSLSTLFFILIIFILHICTSLYVLLYMYFYIYFYMYLYTAIYVSLHRHIFLST